MPRFTKASFSHDKSMMMRLLLALLFSCVIKNEPLILDVSNNDRSHVPSPAFQDYDIFISPHNFFWNQGEQYVMKSKNWTSQ